jgi:hypothetical protein
MKLKRKKVGDRSYELVDRETGKAIATASQTGEHGRDNYPWDWSLSDEMIFGRLDMRTGHSAESLKDIVDTVEGGADQYGLLKPVARVDPYSIKEGQVFRSMTRGRFYFYRATQDAYGGELNTYIPANDHKGELTEVVLIEGDTVTLYADALAPVNREQKREEAIAKAKEEAPESALAAMVRKMDSRYPGQRGYVTNRDELVAILSEVTSHTSVGIYYGGESGGDISVEIKLSLTLERKLL